MITNLSINNIVLIDHLELEVAKGLSVLTGETGSGKSILLDALGLALGARADNNLIRHGQTNANISVSFNLNKDHNVFLILKEKGIDTEENLIIRRSINKAGKSKAFINDMPVTVQLLKKIGSQLIEIHGQFQTQGLLNPETHCTALDDYAGIYSKVKELGLYWSYWQKAIKNLSQAKKDIEYIRQQEDYLKYTVKELETLSPEQGEEEFLSTKRKKLLNYNNIKDVFETANNLLNNETNGISLLLGKLQNSLDKTGIKEIIETAERAGSEINDLIYQLENLKANDGANTNELEEVENRFFALKDCAKKHHCKIDELPNICEELSKKLELITDQETALGELEKDVVLSKEKFKELAEIISLKRIKAAMALSCAVNSELPDLKLDKARFSIEVFKTENEDNWNARGFDKVRFLASTNPQTPAAEINKIASGGELSRFMLALKVVLAELGSIPTLIFDEVDSGIGGATADAVGKRLKRLSRKYQVLVVTHSPQVAARADTHWVVSKSNKKTSSITKIALLKTPEMRQEEIARMLSGAKISIEARAAAVKLLEGIESHAA